MSIFSILNIAKGSLSATQTAIQVTSNNIANVNTAGYAREEAILEEQRPTPTPVGLLGDGVTVKTVRRYYDKYVESSMRTKNGDVGEQSILATYLNRIQQFLNEDNSNLTTNITSYFNDWESLSADPTDTGVRQTLASQGVSLAQTLNTLYADLRGIQTELDAQVSSEVDNINTLLTGIATLNQQIIESGGDESSTNAYQDQKTALLSELSKKMGIQAFDDEYGRTTVLTANGRALVEYGSAWQLTTVTDSGTGHTNVAWEDGSGNVADITGDLGAGELKGLVDARDVYAEGFVDDLDTLASSIIDSVKWTVTSGGVSTTTSFFTGTGAGDMAVTQSLVDDPTLIPSSSDPDNNPTGNDIALAMADLIDQKLVNGTSTFTDYSAAMMADVGQVTQSAQNAAEYNENALAVLTSQRESVSGVSIDEEMANLIKYQYAYQAAAKLFNTADELLQSLLAVKS